MYHTTARSPIFLDEYAIIALFIMFLLTNSLNLILLLRPLLPPQPLAQLVLDKESFTLEEILEEDDVIQECKSLNGRLINLCVPYPPLTIGEHTLLPLTVLSPILYSLSHAAPPRCSHP